ncbi:ATP-binding protein [Streptomyces sp. NPDC006446]|uniref:ATP-binding protein n=1 Tax=Streptomyces sp. NPDC006446 TaxID=3154301 RepID=UPI0033ACC72D
MCGQDQRSATGTVAVSRQVVSTGPGTPADIREAVRHALAGRSGGRTRDEDGAVGDVLLVASELVTNAMLHGGGVTAFEVTPTEREVHLSVSDRSDRLPVPVRRFDDAGRLRVGGHGWMIVCTLASDVAISNLRAGGKRITAVVPLSTSSRG